MLNKLCKELKNWFEKSKQFGTYTISNNSITGVDVAEGQYYRIIGSIFNDGIYKKGAEPEHALKDETFDGAVWLLAIPKEIEELAAKIQAWEEKYGTLDSAALSPFNSESFGGYSYSKSGSASSGGSTNPNGWKSAFADELNRWRKL